MVVHGCNCSFSGFKNKNSVYYLWTPIATPIPAHQWLFVFICFTKAEREVPYPYLSNSIFPESLGLGSPRANWRLKYVTVL